MTLHMNMVETLFIGVLVYICGRYILSKSSILQKFFIPAPVVGGLIFAIITSVGYANHWFIFEFDDNLRDLLMTMFFTTVGYSASGKLLKQGGRAVFLFLFVAVGLLIMQNIVALGLAHIFHQTPMWGMSLGSISMSGGHGTSAAFAPILESKGATGALSISLAASTFGLIAGSLVGGPVGKRLMKKYKLNEAVKENKQGTIDSLKIFFSKDIVKNFKSIFKFGHNEGDEEHLKEKNLLTAVLFISVAMGIGAFITPLIAKIGLTLPVYLMPMLIAAIIRNIIDALKKEVHMAEMGALGSIALALFLSMALMSLKLWDLYALALPVIVILLAQVLLMFFYAYFVTFKVMGKDYDAAVLTVGHCGCGLGATPNAIANMDAFTKANMPSEKAFIVLPLVASLFMDFFNTAIITAFIYFLS